MVAILTAKDIERIRRAYDTRQEQVVIDYTYQGRRLIVETKRPGKIWDDPWLIQVYEEAGHVTSRQNFGSIEEMIRYANL